MTILSVHLSVSLSVRPSGKRVICDKMEKRSVQILYRMRNHLVWFSENKNGWWGRPFLPEILGQPAPVGAKSPILNGYSSIHPQP